VTPPRSLRNVILNWVAFAFSVGINFFLSPFVVHTLGNTEYGIWVLLGSVVGYMGLLDLGVRSAVMRYVARHHARVEDAEASQVASAGLTIFGVTGLLAIIATAVIAVFLDRLFKIPSAYLGVARLVVLVGGLNVAVALVSGVFGGTLSALQRFDIQGITSIVIGALRAMAIFLGLRAGWGILGLAFIQLGVGSLWGVVQYAMSRRLYPQLVFTFRGLDRANLKKIFSFSVYSSLLHVSVALIFSADSVVIGTFLPVASITFFAIASTLTEYTRNIFSTISQTITPRASAMQAVGALGDLERVLLRAGAMASLVTLPITISFVLRGGTFIGLWMGPAYAASSGQVLLILAVALSFAAARQVVMSTMIGMNRHRSLAPFYLAEGLLNVGMSVYWVRTMGIRGVALGTAVPNLVTNLLVIPWLVRQVLGTRLRAIWVGFWLRPLAGYVPFALATFAIERVWTAHSLVSFFAGVAAALPVAAVGAWYVGLTSADRVVFTSTLKGAFATKSHVPQAAGLLQVDSGRRGAGTGTDRHPRGQP
jgi:O-antigen/teichoic acid export membrane protein